MTLCLVRLASAVTLSLEHPLAFKHHMTQSLSLNPTLQSLYTKPNIAKLRIFTTGNNGKVINFRKFSVFEIILILRLSGTLNTIGCNNCVQTRGFREPNISENRPV